MFQFKLLFNLWLTYVYFSPDTSFPMYSNMAEDLLIRFLYGQGGESMQNNDIEFSIIFKNLF